jgi:FAD/FMN-containing dehydrogenase
MTRRARRWLLGLSLGFLALVAAIVGRPAFHLARAVWNDRDGTEVLPAGIVDDSSRLNRTAVAEVWNIPADPLAAEAQLQSLLARARSSRLHVSIAGARHSQGGHTIAPDGIVINMLPFRAMSLDETNRILTVGAGARWSDVITYLNAHKLSVGVMQSNDTFSVGGSLSVNCHGWQLSRPPMVSTVESFRLMTADGSIQTCSRTENPELFSLAAGGYGLFGVILDVRLRVVPNERYRVARYCLNAESYEAEFQERALKPGDAQMAFGRLCIVPGEDSFLKEALLTVFHRDPADGGELPALGAVSYPGLIRTVYRSSIDSDYGKSLRWTAEKQLGETLLARHYSRNQLLKSGVEVLQERTAERVDILHEYFVPIGQVARFLARLREVIPRHRADLLNITVRYVEQDEDTVLRYAETNIYSFVMLFNQPRTIEADATMAALTQDLIDAALASNGRYYLPYRLHATPEQFHKAYPRADQFFERQRHYDPAGMFQNQFSLRYGAARRAGTVSSSPREADHLP